MPKGTPLKSRTNLPSFSFSYSLSLFHVNAGGVAAVAAVEATEADAAIALVAPLDMVRVLVKVFNHVAHHLQL